MVASDAAPPQQRVHSLWRWPYVALTEAAIIEILGGLYMLLYAFVAIGGTSNYPENLASMPPYLMFLAGGILLLLKRKIGVFVSLASIAYLYFYGAYSWTLPPFNELDILDRFRESWYDFTDPFGIPSTAVVVSLLIIGWWRVQWTSNTLDNRSENLADDVSVIPRQNNHHRTARVLFFTAVPIISVVLLYLVFVGDIRTGLKSVEGECSADNPNVSQIYLGKAPESATLYGVAANPVTNKIYVPHSLNGTVAVIDGTSDKVIKIIDLKTGTTSLDGVAINSITNRVYVANSGDPASLLFVIDGNTDNVVKSIPVGKYAIGVAVDTSLNRIYVASNGDNTVSIIDGYKDEKISAVYIPINPRFVSANENDHKVYVSGLVGSKVAAFDGEGSNDDWGLAMIEVPARPNSPGGAILVNPDTNKVYTSSTSGIAVINGSSNKILHTIGLNDFNAAFQYGVNSVSNEVYTVISNTVPGKLVVIDGNTDTIKKQLPVGTSYLFGISANPATGKVYVADAYDGSLYVVSKTTSCY